MGPDLSTGGTLPHTERSAIVDEVLATLFPEAEDAETRAALHARLHRRDVFKQDGTLLGLRRALPLIGRIASAQRSDFIHAVAGQRGCQGDLVVIAAQLVVEGASPTGAVAAAGSNQDRGARLAGAMQRYDLPDGAMTLACTERLSAVEAEIVLTALDGMGLDLAPDVIAAVRTMDARAQAAFLAELSTSGVAVIGLLRTWSESAVTTVRDSVGAEGEPGMRGRSALRRHHYRSRGGELWRGAFDRLLDEAPPLPTGIEKMLDRRRASSDQVVIFLGLVGTNPDMDPTQAIDVATGIVGAPAALFANLIAREQAEGIVRPAVVAVLAEHRLSEHATRAFLSMVSVLPRVTDEEILLLGEACATIRIDGEWSYVRHRIEADPLVANRLGKRMIEARSAREAFAAPQLRAFVAPPEPDLEAVASTETEQPEGSRGSKPSRRNNVDPKSRAR